MSDANIHTKKERFYLTKLLQKIDIVACIHGKYHERDIEIDLSSGGKNVDRRALK